MASQKKPAAEKSASSETRFLRDPKTQQPATRPQPAKHIPPAPVVFSDWASI